MATFSKVVFSGSTSGADILVAANGKVYHTFESSADAADWERVQIPAQCIEVRDDDPDWPKGGGDGLHIHGRVRKGGRFVTANDVS